MRPSLVIVFRLESLLYWVHKVLSGFQFSRKKDQALVCLVCLDFLLDVYSLWFFPVKVWFSYKQTVWPSLVKVFRLESLFYWVHEVLLGFQFSRKKSGLGMCLVAHMCIEYSIACTLVLTTHQSCLEIIKWEHIRSSWVMPQKLIVVNLLFVVFMNERKYGMTRKRSHENILCGPKMGEIHRYECVSETGCCGDGVHVTCVYTIVWHVSFWCCLSERIKIISMTQWLFFFSSSFPS